MKISRRLREGAKEVRDNRNHRTLRVRHRKPEIKVTLSLSPVKVSESAGLAPTLQWIMFNVWAWSVTDHLMSYRKSAAALWRKLWKIREHHQTFNQMQLPMISRTSLIISRIGVRKYSSNPWSKTPSRMRVSPRITTRTSSRSHKRLRLGGKEAKWVGILIGSLQIGLRAMISILMSNSSSLLRTILLVRMRPKVKLPSDQQFLISERVTVARRVMRRSLHLARGAPAPPLRTWSITLSLMELFPQSTSSRSKVQSTS